MPASTLPPPPPPPHETDRADPRPSPLRVPLLTAGALAATTGVVALADPRVHHVPLCPLRSLTGLDCPLCGGLRAVTSLTRGELTDALGYNLVVVLAIPVAVATWFLWIRRRRQNRPLVPPRWFEPAAWTIAIVFAVARNVPAFAWLNSAT